MTCYWDKPCEPGCEGTATGWSPQESRRQSNARPRNHVIDGELKALIRVAIGSEAAKRFGGRKFKGER